MILGKYQSTYTCRSAQRIEVFSSFGEYEGFVLVKYSFKKLSLNSYSGQNQGRSAKSMTGLSSRGTQSYNQVSKVIVGGGSWSSDDGLDNVNIDMRIDFGDD
ncbi:hypothetical protein DFA_05067 [Cavenderia fasciculata]|uniref:Uncharacterized protein n=1 Tax=Cavenderia fasciculata TaxID=261658 RepID=F4PN84_CACFS|nr:uncharacterized protein DFA_05067 [Cavenderia fasciculata]EGG22937.1 hypothetical protein DFA_05067 [Cavenderia fasciculata]|eukprot:XP_004360788.1 hypothetical protein DFA_05067 [Cavenderia fasciculata]